MTVLIVLLLLSITLGLSYAIVRSQTTALQIQRNASSGANRSGSARQTAMTGMVLALKKMHTSEWCYGDGVNTTLSGPIGDYESYHVIYAAGDPALALDDPDSPYRVTLLSTGKATDPSDPERTSTHRARAVVRLVPRSVADEPTDWSTMQEYTVYQSKAQPFKLDIPCRLEGKVRIQGSLHIAPNYPTPIGGEAWRQYLEDLRKMSSDPDADYRPLSSRPVLDHSLQTPQDQDALEHLGVWRWWYDSTPSDETEPDWGLPSACVEYQIYPGGPVYEVPQLGARVEDAVLGPDPEMNPLGIFQRVGDLAIGKNVTVRGSLFSSGRIDIEGENVRFEAVELPAVCGSADPLRLPAASCKWFTVKPTASGSVTGLVAVFEELKVEKNPDTVEFHITGRVITKRLLFKERENWHPGDEDWWSARYDQFRSDPRYPFRLLLPYYFPVWMADQGCAPQPRLTIRPDPSDVAYHYHWKKPYDPIYVPHPDDHPPGHPDDKFLRWDLVEWTDSL